MEPARPGLAWWGEEIERLLSVNSFVRQQGLRVIANSVIQRTPTADATHTVRDRQRPNPPRRSLQTHQTPQHVMNCDLWGFGRAVPERNSRRLAEFRSEQPERLIESA